MTDGRYGILIPRAVAGSAALGSTGIVVSTLNSTTTPLGAGATFAGVGEDIRPYQEIDMNVAGAPAVAPGTLYFEFSPDGTNWDVSVPVTLTGPGVVPQTLRVVLPYFRARYVNGGTALTQLRLTICYHIYGSMRLTRFLNQTIDDTEGVENVRAIIGGLRPDNTYGNVPVTRNNDMRVSINDVGGEARNHLVSADRAIFGAGIVSQRISRVIAQFDVSLASNAVTATVTNGGTVVQASGQVTLASGTNANGTAKLETDGRVVYAPGREIYAQFTALFTATDAATQDSRIGMFDDNNGFFIGYDGTTFGLTTRSAASDVFTSRASWNTDLLTGAATSRFTRGGVAEAIDLTKENVWRIRFGWLGAAPIYFEVMAPDGDWVVYHIVRQPNSSATPSLISPNLPVRAQVIKASSNATDVQIKSSSWDAGTVESESGFTPDEVKGHKYVTANLAGQTEDQTLYTVATGRDLRVTSIVVFVSNSSLAASGRLDIKDDTTVLLPVTVTAATNQANAGVSMAITFPVPIRFATSVVCDVVSGTLNYSITIVGYEQEPAP